MFAAQASKRRRPEKTVEICAVNELTEQKEKSCIIQLSLALFEAIWGCLETKPPPQPAKWMPMNPFLTKPWVFQSSLQGPFQPPPMAS